MHPQRSEDFVGVVTVFELFVELVRSASICDAAIEVYQPHCEILAHHVALLELLVHYACFGVMQKRKDHLDVPCSDVGVRHNILFAEQKASEFKYLLEVVGADSL